MSRFNWNEWRAANRRRGMSCFVEGLPRKLGASISLYRAPKHNAGDPYFLDVAIGDGRVGAIRVSIATGVFGSEDDAKRRAEQLYLAAKALFDRDGTPADSRRRHSRDGSIRCDLCAPVRCMEAQ
jgi:hypothetical protein